VVQNGESVWALALQRYDVPVWLFRQYNPELDLHRVRKGTRLNFPVLASNIS
jgi:membrane-bound lytic murein transglycosylase D